MQSKNINTAALFSLAIVPMSGLGIDIFVPSLPAIAQHFSASPSEVQLSVGIYLIGYALLQTIWGTLSDSIGRRPILLAGITGIGLTCALIPFSPNVFTFLALRFLQGVFVGPAGILARALLTDTLQGRTLEKYSHNLTIAWAMGPIVAPFIGGYLQHYFGWHAPFFFLAIYCLILLLLIFVFLPETIKQRQKLSFKQTRSTYQEIFTHPIFLWAATILALAYGSMAIFNVVGPFLVQTELGYTPIVYGRIALLMGLAWFLGSLLNRWIRQYLEAAQIATIIFISLQIINLIFLVLSVFYFNLWVLVLPLMALFCGTSIIFSNFFGLCVSFFSKNAGAASAVMGTLFVVGAGLLSAGASLLKTKTLIPLAITYALLLLISIIIYIKITPRIKLVLSKNEQGVC